MPPRWSFWKTLCVVLLSSSLLVACGGEASVAPIAGANEYVVERSEAEGVETVRTVSGSKWGGTPHLVEELVIGEETGEDPYLFGSIAAAWATGDRIYVVDSQVPVVRVYDHQGIHLLDIGRSGQGPGDYSRPGGLAVRDSGEVLIADTGNSRITEFDPEGNYLEDWSLRSFMEAYDMHLADDGQIFTPIVDMSQSETSVSMNRLPGMKPLGAADGEGAVVPRESDYVRQTVAVAMGDRTSSVGVPFSPSHHWNFAPGGQMISGVGDQYRFYIDGPDGRTILVEKAWQPTPIGADEKVFRAEVASDRGRGTDPDFTFPIADVPDTKPAYTGFTSDRSGRVWVTRQGPSVPDATCAESPRGDLARLALAELAGRGIRLDVGGAPSEDNDDDQQCWANTYSYDLFEIATGEFLGNVSPPEAGFRSPLFANDDVVLAAITDELGTIRLKMYRLALN